MKGLIREKHKFIALLHNPYDFPVPIPRCTCDAFEAEPVDVQRGNLSSCQFWCHQSRIHSRVKRVCCEPEVPSGNCRDCSGGGGGGGGCTPTDCSVSSWSSWSSCDCQGDRSRSRYVIHHESCGGWPCPATMKRWGKCSPPAPISCLVRIDVNAFRT